MLITSMVDFIYFSCYYYQNHNDPCWKSLSLSRLCASAFSLQLVKEVMTSHPFIRRLTAWWCCLTAYRGRVVQQQATRVFYFRHRHFIACCITAFEDAG